MVQEAAWSYETVALYLVGVVIWHDVLGVDRVCLQQACQGSVLRVDAYVCLHHLVPREVFCCQC